MSYQVFISFKNLDTDGQPTRDSRIAEQLYHGLKERGVNVFFSNEEVQRKCRPDYGDLIDEALESSRVLLLVGTSVDYIESKWVKYEWNSFKNEINSGRKDGYIIPVIDGFSVGDLPFALRHGQVYTADELNRAVDMVAGVLGISHAEPSHSVEEMNNIAVSYYYGTDGKSQSYTEAVKWLRKAAERGFAPAQNNLGMCCQHGVGTEQNEAEAAKWFSKAAEQGDAPAQYNIGCCCEKGEGVAQDIHQARHWYELAAAQGNEDAKEALKRLR